MLALDELDAVRLTDFTEELLIELLGARYQANAVTLLACNEIGPPIPPRIVARMKDRRFQVVDLGETDLRAIADEVALLDPWDRGEGER